MKDEIDKRWHDLGEFIREQRNVGQLSLRKLSELAGVSNPYLSQIERGLRKPSAEILQQIARALQISAESLYERAGLLSSDNKPRVGVREAIAADQDLTSEHRQPWLNVYEGFAATRH